MRLNLKKFKSLWILFLIALSSAGCSLSHPQQAAIVVRCEIHTEPPVKTGVLEDDLDAILVYTELLKKDLEACSGK